MAGSSQKWQEGITVALTMVTSDMIDDLRESVLDVVEVPLTGVGAPEDMNGMIFGQMEAPAAMQLPGPMWHDRIATSLCDALDDCL